MRTGELARKAEVNIQTIRYCEPNRLIARAGARFPGGQRSYLAWDLEMMEAERSVLRLLRELRATVEMDRGLRLTDMRLRSFVFGVLGLAAWAVANPRLSSEQEAGGVPVFEVVPLHSAIKFSVKASVALEGTFDKWDAKMAFASADVTSAALQIQIHAASVNTGSGMKDNKLKGKDFFYVEENPLITFVSNKVIQTGPTSFEVDGDFTIRGVTKPEKLTLTVTGKGTGSGEIHGTMAFDRKDYGMNKGIPLIKIADRVEVTVNLKAKQVSGPRLVYKE